MIRQHKTITTQTIHNNTTLLLLLLLLLTALFGSPPGDMPESTCYYSFTRETLNALVKPFTMHFPAQGTSEANARIIIISMYGSGTLVVELTKR